MTGKLWLERGGAYVLANIRGGGEFGPAWHEAGLTTRRQIIYDDFAAVAEDLIARKITSPRASRAARTAACSWACRWSSGPNCGTRW
jgi:prolyl oligopeptidase PreP (S9A serine peptidase family)